MHDPKLVPALSADPAAPQACVHALETQVGWAHDAEAMHFEHDVPAS
jgi:hypothetical protein